MWNFSENAAAGGVGSLVEGRHKLDVLRNHCAAVRRPYEMILKSHLELPVIVGASRAAVEAKLEARYRPSHQIGVRYFIAAIHSDDIECCELLARQVMPEFV